MTTPGAYQRGFVMGLSGDSPDDVDQKSEQVPGGEGCGGVAGWGAGSGSQAVGAQQVHALRLRKRVQPCDCQGLAVSAHQQLHPAPSEIL